MSKRTELVRGNLYHLYNRGVEYRNIFAAERNWWFFTGRFKKYLNGHGQLLAYCLMPNHYRMLVQIDCDNFSRKVMQPFGTSYVMAFNKQERRVGPLFQGRFKAKHVDTDDYLVTLSRYIHLNPVKAYLVKQPSDWGHSSYQDYVSGYQRNWLNTQPVLDVFKENYYQPGPGITLQQAYARYVTTTYHEDYPWEGWWRDVDT